MALDPALIKDIGDATNARLKQFKGFYGAFNDAIRGKLLDDCIIPELRVAVGRYLAEYAKKHPKDKRTESEYRFTVLSKKNGILRVQEVVSKAIFDFTEDRIHPPRFNGWSKIAHPKKEMVRAASNYVFSEWREISYRLYVVYADQTVITFAVDDRVEISYQYKGSQAELFCIVPRPGEPLHGEVDGQVEQRAHYLAQHHFAGFVD